MNDFFIFFRREATIFCNNIYYYLLPLFMWLTGFFVLRLALPNLNIGDDATSQGLMFIMTWFLFLLFFALTAMGAGLYAFDIGHDMAIDIMLAGRSLFAFVYAKAAALLLFSALPLWAMTMLALSLMGVNKNIIIIFFYGGFLFLAHLCLLINFLASLTQWGRGGVFFMVIIILPLAIPCFIFLLMMITSGAMRPVVFFQLAYFLLCFSFLPIASAFIIKQES